MGIVVPEETDEVQQVGIVEGTVFEAEELPEVLITVVQDKLVGIVIHAPEEIGAFVDDGFALPPSQNCRKECGNFDILFFLKTVGNADGIILDEVGAVVFADLDVQVIPEC